MQSKDKIMKVLALNGIEFSEPEVKCKYDFNRKLIIKTFNSDVTMTWWSNIMYMDIAGSTIPFTHLSVDGCWPNQFSTNINLMNDRDKVAIIPVFK